MKGLRIHDPDRAFTGYTLFEVTPENDIVWEFVNPYSVEAGWEAIYRCFRYPPEYVEPLLRHTAGTWLH